MQLRCSGGRYSRHERQRELNKERIYKLETTHQQNGHVNVQNFKCRLTGIWSDIYNIQYSYLCIILF